MLRIEAASLVPGRGAPVADGVVLVDGTTIAYAGPVADAPPADPAADRVRVDTLLPGLWDAHTHLLGTWTADPSALYREPVALRAARATGDLAAALRAGVTSVREAGGLGVHLAPAVAEGSVPGPRVFAAGAHLSTTGGHGDLHDLPLPWVRELATWEPAIRPCDGVADVVAAVREQLRAGAEVIKVYASGGVLSTRNEPQHQQFTREELEAVVEVAGLAGRAVMAHAHGAGAALAAVAAGVRTIEHGTYLDDEALAAMAERDVLLVPTRLIGRELLRSGPAAGMSGEMRAKMAEVDRHAAASVARAREAGVGIAMGSDVFASGVDRPAAWGNQGRELALLVEAGLTPLAAIEAATANGPATLGERGPASGRLAAGCDADLLAVRGDPTVDVGLLADPAAVTHVWQAGHLVHSAGGAGAGRP